MTEQQNTTQADEHGFPVEPTAGDDRAVGNEHQAERELSADAADPSEAKPNREAAKYRRQLRDTEAERDALAARLATMERRQVDRLAAEVLADPSDFAPALDELRDAGGALDEEKVSAALDELIKAKPHYAKRRVVPTRSSAEHSGGSYTPPRRMGAIFGG
ncbi:hypothetical protein [Saccharopolyspora cebuensis]|uniref:hypothetical protein n=1 Tax=Saccharopolyspora cebuensis TaxID=418759 RepID=UPI0031EDCBAC